ncbi:hypothetical protein F4775DRAFT_597510 [Biscogniauxia sp. FL1348]|nr:hypothetical protein F4775DRAFT_597510 [Biscogniauxia sp. FL1348]
MFPDRHDPVTSYSGTQPSDDDVDIIIIYLIQVLYFHLNHLNLSLYVEQLRGSKFGYRIMLSSEPDLAPGYLVRDTPKMPSTGTATSSSSQESTQCCDVQSYALREFLAQSPTADGTVYGRLITPRLGNYEPKVEHMTRAREAIDKFDRKFTKKE